MEKLNMKVLLALVICISAVQCRYTKPRRDVSHLAHHGELSGGGYQFHNQALTRPSFNQQASSYPDIQSQSGAYGLPTGGQSFIGHQAIQPNIQSSVYQESSNIGTAPIYSPPQSINTFSAPQQSIETVGINHNIGSISGSYPTNQFSSFGHSIAQQEIQDIQPDIHSSVSSNIGIGSFNTPSLNTFAHSAPHQNIESLGSFNQNIGTAAINLPSVNTFTHPVSHHSIESFGGYNQNIGTAAISGPSINTFAHSTAHHGIETAGAFDQNIGSFNQISSLGNQHSGHNFEAFHGGNIGVSDVGFSSSGGGVSSGYDYPRPNLQRFDLPTERRSN